MKSLGLRRQPMKLVLLNLVPPVPYTWSTSSSSISTMSHLIIIIRLRLAQDVTHRPGIISLSLLLSRRYTEPDMLAMSQPRYRRYGPDTGMATVVTSDTRSNKLFVHIFLKSPITILHSASHVAVDPVEGHHVLLELLV